MGYTTRGRGITVHRADCHNIAHLEEEERGRLVRVSWDGMKGQRYMARVRIEAMDRVGLLRDVTTLVADEKVSMTDMQTSANKGGGTQYILTSLEVVSMDQLLRIMQRLESISGVYEVTRDTPDEKVQRA